MNSYKLQFGAYFHSPQKIKFRVWAPKNPSLALAIINQNGDLTSYRMRKVGLGIFDFSLDLPPDSTTDLDYFYELENGRLLPDPCSRWQPAGVHGPSRVYDPQRFVWTDDGWKGIPLSDYVIYELHIGTFTSEGTFEGAIQKLPHLCSLGITAVELMPVMEFPGERNWGYDVACPYAAHHAYGGPSGLKAFIDACHSTGLAVILDVVYNHLGPEGNYLGEFGFYFTDRYQTPWGSAVNFDGPYCDYVRKYFIDNALFWLKDYHVDALRLDAVHSIYDKSPRHILEEIQTQFRQKAELLGRRSFLIVESDLNDIKLLSPSKSGGYGIDAQWNDDFHHAIFAALTKSSRGYFQDFGSIGQIGKAMTEGFVYDGQWSHYRKKRFGTSSKNISGEHFVVCLQNHDQVGNAGLGKRLGRIIPEKQLRLAAALLFFTPSLPLIFMGEEWNAKTEFLYFTSFEDEELGKRVSEGYKAEFQLLDDEKFSPQNKERFDRSKIQWSELENPASLSMLEFYKKLISLRRKPPLLFNKVRDNFLVQANEKEKWMLLSSNEQLIIANFRDVGVTLSPSLPPETWELALSSSDDFEKTDENCRLCRRLSIEEASPTSIFVPSWTALVYTKRKK